MWHLFKDFYKYYKKRQLSKKLSCLFLRFPRGKNMQISTIENREDYVSIKELMDAINQKYMLYSYNSKNNIVRAKRQLLEKK